MLTDEKQDREIPTHALREAFVESNIEVVKKYYCHCGGEMIYCSATADNTACYRCEKCGHMIAANYIDRNRRIKTTVELVKKET